MFVLLLIFRQVKPALWKAPLWHPFGASNGNLNPHLASRAGQVAPWLCLFFTYRQLEAVSCNHYSLQKQRDAVWHPFAFGASNGNRTRIASLGSWSFTIRLYPRTCILYTIPRHLSRGISNFFSLSENFRPTRRDIFFPRPRTFAAYRHMMIVETAPALSYFIPSGGSL